MDLEQLRDNIVAASRILHQQGVAAAFGHVSARIPGSGPQVSGEEVSNRVWDYFSSQVKTH